MQYHKLKSIKKAAPVGAAFPDKTIQTQNYCSITFLL